MILYWFFMVSYFVLTFPFFSFCCFSCVFSKIKLFGLGLFFDFLVFYACFFRLINSLQKNKLSVLQAGLIQFGYCGFFFLSHAVSLCFMVFNKLRLLVRIVI